MEKNKILLINDISGYGKVALSAMIPILSHMKFQVFNLPTAVVSNTLDYGQFEILDTTEYMKKTLKVWDNLGFSFDAICTGFITSAGQAELVYEYCKEQKKKGTKIIVDPIMGDDGKLYNGISEKTVLYMTKLCAVADVIVPNITEACIMTGVDPQKDDYTYADVQEILEKFYALGCKSVVITSIPYENTSCTILSEDRASGFEAIPYEEIPVRFPGTGDIFTSIATGKTLRDNHLENAVRTAMQAVSYLISKNETNIDKYKGIPIERYLEDIL